MSHRLNIFQHFTIKINDKLHVKNAHFQAYVKMKMDGCCRNRWENETKKTHVPQCKPTLTFLTTQLSNHRTKQSVRSGHIFPLWLHSCFWHFSVSWSSGLRRSRCDKIIKHHTKKILYINRIAKNKPANFLVGIICMMSYIPIKIYVSIWAQSELLCR